MTGALHAERLRCERLEDPLAVGARAPRLSWIVRGPGRDQYQTGYRITVAADPDDLLAERSLAWDSGLVAGDETLAVTYGGPAPAAGERLHWRVQLWDRDGRPGRPSAIGSWGAGLPARAWRASWIGHGHPWRATQPPSGDDLDLLTNAELTAALLRTTFRIDRPVVRATLYATARGLYRLQLNGERVGDEELAPGWTDYRRRIHYRAHDVTSLLRDGENALGVLLGEGWYAGFVGFSPKQRGAHYGNRPSALVHLRVEHLDGSRTTVSSDGSWRASDGPVVCSDLQLGERYDARREAPGWDRPGFDDRDWEPVVLHEPTDARLLPDPAEPIRRVADLTPVALDQPRPGEWVFDLGQNMVGRTRLRIPGPTAPGTVVQLRFAEARHPDGTLYTENLRGAQDCCDVVVPRGDGDTLFEPCFTTHGFRYVAVTGLPAPPALDDLTGVVLHSDVRRSASFACSHELLNRIDRNVEWSLRGNLVGLPTDCPQRDERLGWLADVQVIGDTACRGFDLSAFLPRWLTEVRDAQTADGIFPDVAPVPPRQASLSRGAPGWGDAGVLVPWTAWCAYGDRRLLEDSWESMERWMAHLERANPGRLRHAQRHNDYGDWLNVGADTPRELLATAYWALDARLMARIADLLGRPADGERYRRLHREIADAFVAAFVAADGTLHQPTQTGYLLALRAGVLPERLRAGAVAGLVADIAARGGRLSTGFLGSGLLCPVLSEHGHATLAYDLALSQEHPSWGASIRHGATTMWERWDGWTPEHGFQSPNMNSFNHYAFGAIGEWLHRHVAGLDADPDVPGEGQLLIRPQLDERLTWARASSDGVRGPARAGWARVGDRLTVTVEVPPNCRATVLIPGSDPAALREGDGPAADAEGVAVRGVDDDRIVVAIGSGSYAFTAPWPTAPPAVDARPTTGVAAPTTPEEHRGHD
ncbi:Alfa-L-rhamnosidase [Patulibacter medicamentivorans]|uniref:alpha-L-rhamnosidase n=1 Tax=Patulibacter medicamentivorans TaxID=1097667 RepID=H0E881_9ACTN|nr:alpha-L-rhamnosidase [Patulibacter medicamentivorans]EHN10146.1 Alfa-L-rhamnosidase [Patulibacter medicamentivorans]